MKVIGIYKITSPSNRIYIGQTVDFIKRKSHYRNLKRNHQIRLFNSIKKYGWDNFFELRCGNYDGFKSRKEASKEFLEKGNINTSTWSELDWLHLNKGQAEIHMMMLSEKVYDAIQESVPIQLKPNEWHIPMIKIIED